ncbi:MAG: lipoyl synthase [Candidatus Altiarchaeales archaeon]|nr:lipoyl synthase [Candidatus Altiarchaeales archaeon]MBD3416011.1 lipoyl synthase [Candidatus Altiarchaeales archaeon]
MEAGKPHWLKAPIGGHGRYASVKDVLRKHNLNTVCEEARCPNMGECWGCGTATFMILGETCTRNCSFCAVKSSDAGDELDIEEPANLAEAVRELNLAYVVLTSVDRDDLKDKGSGRYAECIRALKGVGAKVEVLIPDYTGDELEAVVNAGPDVVAHNIEVVERLQHLRDSRASYQGSLQTLLEVKKLNPSLKTKSSIMLGLGEKEGEIVQAMDDLRAVGCDFLVIGQYLQPTRKQTQVVEYVEPRVFQRFKEKAFEKGFEKVTSEPLARTSYQAAETAK